MSQTSVTERPRYCEEPNVEFSYAPLSAWAIVSACLAFLSLLTFIWISCAVIAVVALFTSLWTVWRIRRSEGMYSGTGLAKASALVTAMGLAGALSMHAYLYATEVPEGYRRVSFARDISAKALQNADGTLQVHPDVKALDGQKIFVKGYMYPVRQTHGLTEFILVKDNKQCCFGGQPKQTDMILVKMAPENPVDYYVGLVAVAGTFKAEAPRPSAGLQPIYQLEGEIFQHAQTTY